MEAQEDIYTKLQLHLDTMPIGFPKAENGSDIRVLKAFFSPEEANMVLFINFKPSTEDEICERAVKAGISRDNAEARGMPIASIVKILSIGKNFFIRFFISLIVSWRS